MTLPVVDLPDDPFARGQAHGTILGAEIRRMIDLQCENILGSPSAQRQGLKGRDDLLTWSWRYASVTKFHFPELWLELEGIAEGSGTSAGEILALNLHLEMVDLANPAMTGQATAEGWVEAGCTDIAAVRSNGHGCVLGQTYDLRDFFEEFTFAFRTKSGGLPVCALSFAGILAAAGLNGRGFGVVINKLYAAGAGIGAPHPFILRAALEAPSTGQALSIILGSPRACGLHYLCGDATGLLFPLESSRTAWDLLDHGAVYAHANHFSGERLRNLERRVFARYGAHTLVRLARARQLLDRIGPDATLDDYGAILDDDHDQPLSISCCGAPDLPFGTVSKILFDTHTRTLKMAKGRQPLQPVALEG